MTRLQRLTAVLLASAISLVFAQGAAVRVDGSGNVGVGTNLGTINLGPTKAELDAALKARGAEQALLLREIAAKLNAALARQSAPSLPKPAADEFSAAIVHGFLATVVGKKVPESDWPRVFNELAGKFLETGSRIAATPVTNDKIKALIAGAEVARKAGDLKQTDQLLEEAEKQAIADAAMRQVEFRASSRQAASLLASRASVAFTRLEREKGAKLLERAFEQRADDVASESFWWLLQASDAWTTAGNSTEALRILERARRAAANQVASDPSNSGWQRDLSVSHERIGNTQSAQGDLAGALKSYQASMAIRQKLAASDASNSGWQRDLSVSHNKTGDTQSVQNELAGALKSYQAGMTIRQKLAASDASNSEWQTDVAVSAWKIGTLKGSEQSHGDRRAVLAQGLKILDSLAQQQRLIPKWAGWPERFRKAIADLH